MSIYLQNILNYKYIYLGNKQFLEETDKFMKDLNDDLKSHCKLKGISYQEFTKDIPNNTELRKRLDSDIQWCNEYLKQFN